MRLRSLVPLVVALAAIAPARADDDVSIFTGGFSARFGDVRLRLGYQRYRSRYFYSAPVLPYYSSSPVLGYGVGYYLVPPIYCPPPLLLPPYSPPAFIEAPVVVIFDRGRTASPAATSGFDRLRRDVEVTIRDGRCHLRWRDAPAAVRKVEYEIQDGDRKPLVVRTVLEPPFTAEIDLPEGAAALVVTAFYRDGSSVAIRVPLAAIRRSEG